MPEFFDKQEGELIEFHVASQVRYGILFFIRTMPCLIDENGDLWRFDGPNVYKVGRGGSRE
jgi:hypothetical protein